MTATCPPAPPRGDEAELFRRHHRDLLRAVTRAVNAPRELIEDACQSAWTSLLRRQPERTTIFPWLLAVAVHEAYRLCRTEQRDAHLEDLGYRDGEALTACGTTIDDVVEARRALRLLAQLPERQRHDLSLLVAGFRYRGDRRNDRRAHLYQRQQAPRQGASTHPARRTARRRGGRFPPAGLFMSKMPRLVAQPRSLGRDWT